MQNQSTPIVILKPRLHEVTLMRAILALLIVFGHCFACYNSFWPYPSGIDGIYIYKWLHRCSFAFTLEAFVFVSGYLFAFQRVTLNRKDGLIKLIISKIKRLIIPSIFFSLLYFFLFEEYHGLHSMLYSITRGTGHMWFLPMLFWCFLIIWMLDQIKIGDLWKITFLIVVTLFVHSNMSLRLDRTVVYLPFFYGGYICYKNRDAIKAFISNKRFVLLWVLFTIVFVVFRPLRDILEISYLKRGCTLLYAGLGCLVFYMTCLVYTDKHQLSSFVASISACSFGIYLFQQFILWWGYYYTDFPLFIGAAWLPWCSFIIATVFSYILSYYFLKTKIGKLLIA